MRSRKWIGMLALLGVLLHAGAIVRHNATMTGAAIQYQALLTGLAQLCHGTATADVVAASELPYVPRPSDAQNGCPICSGMGAAIAVVAPVLTSVPVTVPVRVAFPPTDHVVPKQGRAVHPPARGPPAVA